MEACAENNIELIILDRPTRTETLLTDQPRKGIHQFWNASHSCFTRYDYWRIFTND
jgi:hypothetical protein